MNVRESFEGNLWFFFGQVFRFFSEFIIFLNYLTRDFKKNAQTHSYFTLISFLRRVEEFPRSKTLEKPSEKFTDFTSLVKYYLEVTRLSISFEPARKGDGWTGSTIITSLHEKIHPPQKNWQVKFHCLGLKHTWLWQTPVEDSQAIVVLFRPDEAQILLNRFWWLSLVRFSGSTLVWSLSWGFRKVAVTINLKPSITNPNHQATINWLYLVRSVSYHELEVGNI